ncbi:MAG: DUF971 domain-containing protein [Planctomycetaceae bacterium]|nr:DUF971 domain-containing protein [Planctomycetaceae bacterium]
MATAPTAVRALRSAGVFEITWPDGVVALYPFKFLRCECPCAGCVNEFTGERILDPATVPADIAPTAVEMSGNYALKIVWSDNHYTGLYTWDRLDALRSAPEVTS